MATIANIVQDASGSAGSGNAWYVVRSGDIAELWHYSTRMLQWNVAQPDDPSALDYSTGHGSVSDQGGMNTAFRVLGLGLYFSRAGGAHIA